MTRDPVDFLLGQLEHRVPDLEPFLLDEPRELLGPGLVEELCTIGGSAGLERRTAMAIALATAVPRDGAERLCAELVALASGEAPP